MKTKLIFILALILFSFNLINAEDSDKEKKEEKDKKEKKDEKRFQVGFGFFANSPDLATSVSNMERTEAIIDGSSYSYPGQSREESRELNDEGKSYQLRKLALYHLKTMEYGVNTRFLWGFLIGEVSLSLIPVNYANNNYFDITLSPMIGFRSPKFFMPYIMAGPNLSFGFNSAVYNNKFTHKENAVNILNTVVANVGVTAKTGFDLKFEKFSFGLYYQYKVTDFKEIFYWNNMYRANEISLEDAAWNTLGRQSRVGAAVTFYISPKKKK